MGTPTPTLEFVLKVNARKGILDREELDEQRLFYFNQVLRLNAILNDQDPVLVFPGITLDQVVVDDPEEEQLEVEISRENLRIEDEKISRTVYMKTDPDPNNRREIVETLMTLGHVGYAHLYYAAREARSQLADSISYESIPQIAMQKADAPLTKTYRTFKMGMTTIEKLSSYYSRMLMRSDVLEEGQERVLHKIADYLQDQRKTFEFSQKNIYQLLHLMVQCVTKYYR